MSAKVSSYERVAAANGYEEPTAVREGRTLVVENGYLVHPKVTNLQHHIEVVFRVGLDVSDLVDFDGMPVDLVISPLEAENPQNGFVAITADVN